jgi:hypothetical protein
MSITTIGDVWDKVLATQDPEYPSEPPPAISPSLPNGLVEIPKKSPAPLIKTQKVPVDPSERWFIQEQACLLWSGGRNVLTDGQILPFARPFDHWYQKDLRYFRLHVLMDGRLNLDGHPVQAEHQRQPLSLDPVMHSESYFSVCSPESPLGFFGHHRITRSNLLVNRYMPFILSGMIRYTEMPAEAVRNIVPQFYVESRSPDSRPMVDLETQQLRHVRPISDGPVFSLLPFSMGTDMEIRLYRHLLEHYGFATIYIGMPSCDPCDLSSDRLLQERSVPCSITEFEQSRIRRSTMLGFHYRYSRHRKDVWQEMVNDILMSPVRRQLAALEGAVDSLI